MKLKAGRQSVGGIWGTREENVRAFEDEQWTGSAGTSSHFSSHHIAVFSTSACPVFAPFGIHFQSDQEFCLMILVVKKTRQLLYFFFYTFATKRERESGHLN